MKQYYIRQFIYCKAACNNDRSHSSTDDNVGPESIQVTKYLLWQEIVVMKNEYNTFPPKCVT